MRKVKIAERQDVVIGDTNINCPMAFSIALGIKTVLCCHTTCAWFRIEAVYYDGHAHYNGKFAYCGDKLIGEIEK